MNMVLVTPSTDLPIALEEAKAQLRIEDSETADDFNLERLIRAATAEAEKISLHAMLTQTWALYLDDWPAGKFIELPRPPLVSISSITYTTYDGDPASPTTLASSVYFADTNRKPGRVVLKPDQSWPSDRLYPSGAICITFVCGYTAARDIPENARQAILLLITDWNENREPVIMGQGNSISAHPMGVEKLLWSMRAEALQW